MLPRGRVGDANEMNKTYILRHRIGLMYPSGGSVSFSLRTASDDMSAGQTTSMLRTEEEEDRKPYYHIFQLDIPSDGCYLFSFSTPEKPLTYSNALMVQHGQIVGLMAHIPLLLRTSEDPVGGLAITYPVLEDGSIGGPGIVMRSRNPELATMTWEPLMPVKEADAAFKGLLQNVTKMNTMIEEFLDRPGHSGFVEGFTACKEAMDVARS